MAEVFQDLIEYLYFDEYEVDTRESDLDRICFEDTNQYIRIWDIKEKGILYSVFDRGEEIECGYYTIQHSFRD